MAAAGVQLAQCLPGREDCSPLAPLRCQELQDQFVELGGMLHHGLVAALVEDMELGVGYPFLGDVGVCYG